MTIPLISSFMEDLYQKIQSLKYNSTLLLLFFLFANAGFLHSQGSETGQISGFVITNDGKAGQGVVVKLIEINKTAVTNSSGHYEFKKYLLVLIL